MEEANGKNTVDYYFNYSLLIDLLDCEESNECFYNKTLLHCIDVRLRGFYFTWILLVWII